MTDIIIITIGTMVPMGAVAAVGVPLAANAQILVAIRMSVLPKEAVLQMVVLFVWVDADYLGDVLRSSQQQLVLDHQGQGRVKIIMVVTLTHYKAMYWN